MHGTVCIGDAVNKDAPLNRGLLCWFLALPEQQRGVMFRDLCRRSDGTLVNAPSWQGPQGRAGGFGSLRLASASSQYVSLSTGYGLNTATPVVSAWFRIAATTGTYQVIVANAANKVRVMVDNSLNLIVDVSDFVLNLADTSANVTLGKWHHVAFVVKSGDNRVYFDGSLVFTSALTGTLSYSAAGWTIGARLSGTYGLFLNGAVDDVRIGNDLAVAPFIYSASRRGYQDELNWTPSLRGYEINTGGAVTAYPWHYYQQMMAG